MWIGAYDATSPHKLSEAVMLPICIREVHSSNLSRSHYRGFTQSLQSNDGMSHSN